MGVLDNFFAACTKAAAAYQLPRVLISVQDPATGECKTVMSAGAEVLRDSVAEKLGLEVATMDGGETGWPENY